MKEHNDEHLDTATVSALEARLRDLQSQSSTKDKHIHDLLVKSQGAAFEAQGFLFNKHRTFVLNLDTNKDTLVYCATEHLRMQGVFWGLGAMDMLGCADEMPRQEIVEWVMQCYHDDCGGFGGNVGHDPHLLYTQHAIYLLAMCDALERLDVDKVATYVASLQLEDGSFKGDKWGEVDTRFSYCALAGLTILNRRDAVDVKKAMEFIVSCQNFDGGFGAVPGAESHAGYIFTAVATLSIGNGMDMISQAEWDKLAWWLAERQCDSGGLNGRPEKQADVCYSWWVLSTLNILNRLDWIDREQLLKFIIKCQDPTGGIADRPNNIGDVYHTFFGITGCWLLGFFDQINYHGETPIVNPIDPTYALPKRLVEKLQLAK